MNKSDLRVMVIDPLAGTSYPALLKQFGSNWILEEPSDAATWPVPDLYLSPGWIDLHTHVYDGVTQLSVTPDEAGLKTGVHMVIDAGSAGEATLAGFRKYIVPRYETEVRAWLNISSIGLVHLREVSDLSLINIDRTVQAITDNRDFICGVKVRASGAIVGSMGLQPLQLAILAAHEADLPVMVHIGEAPPIADDVLDLLRSGDVVTHCYHGKIGKPWKDEGLPSAAMLRAIEKGVRLDIGHGAASFNYDVCKKAISGGWMPFTISTDVHIRNINGPVYDLATTMTKLMHCGMKLEDVIAAVTTAPADVLRQTDWCNLDGILHRATLFRVTNQPVQNRAYRDAQGNEIVPNQIIEPIAIITQGEYRRLK